MTLLTKRNESEFMEKSARNHRLLYWTVGVELLIMFGLVDAGAVAGSAGLITGEQFLASGIAYVLIASGVLFTEYELG